MSSLATMVVDLLLKTDKFETGAKNAIGAADRIEKKLNSLEGALKHVAFAFGAAFTVEALKGTAEQIDRITKISERLGDTTEHIAGMGHAAQITGTDFEKLTKGLTTMEAKIGERKDIFKQLGLSPEKLAHETSTQALEDIADKIDAIALPADRTAAAVEIFGKKIGPDLQNLLGKGSSGIRELVDEAGQLGIAFSKESGEKVEKMNEGIIRAKEAVHGLSQTFIIELAPAIEKVANGFTKFMKEFNDAKGAPTPETIAEKIKKLPGADFEKFQNLFAKEATRGQAAQLIGEKPEALAPISTRDAVWGGDKGAAERMAQGGGWSGYWGLGHNANYMPASQAIQDRIEEKSKALSDKVHKDETAAKNVIGGGIRHAVYGSNDAIAGLFPKIGERIAQSLDAAALKVMEKRTGEKETKKGGIPGHGSLVDELKKSGLVFGLDHMFDRPEKEKKEKIERVAKQEVEKIHFERNLHEGATGQRKGTSAAFEQLRRTAAQNPGLVIQREHFAEAKKQTAYLRELARNGHAGKTVEPLASH